MQTTKEEKKSGESTGGLRASDPVIITNQGKNKAGEDVFVITRDEEALKKQNQKIAAANEQEKEEELEMPPLIVIPRVKETPRPKYGVNAGGSVAKDKIEDWQVGDGMPPVKVEKEIQTTIVIGTHGMVSTESDDWNVVFRNDRREGCVFLYFETAGRHGEVILSIFDVDMKDFPPCPMNFLLPEPLTNLGGDGEGETWKKVNNSKIIDFSPGCRLLNRWLQNEAVNRKHKAKVEADYKIQVELFRKARIKADAKPKGGADAKPKGGAEPDKKKTKRNKKKLNVISE